MRDILFKAKRKDNGEWVEGYLTKAKWYLDGEEIFAILPTDVCIYPHCEFSEWITIDENTICQYTGLTDKNGNKIWENDVVLDSEEREVYKMVWSQDSMRYCVEKASGFDYEFDSSYASSIEVIGNIFDEGSKLLYGE